MSNKREVEVRGADVEKAIEAGLQKLGVNRSEVIVDVIDEGSRGLLGIGSREAVVRLVTLVSEEPPAPPKPKPQPAAKTAAPTPKPAPKAEPKPTRPTSSTEEVIEADAEEKAMAVEVVTTLLDKLGVDAEITASVSEPDDLTGRKVNVLDIEGDDLGALIGPRGETLNALQYLSRLMVGNQLQKRASFVVDVEGYRRRRQQALARLAERMAKKVVTRRRPVSLEPMPPHERRIIHMTLRENDEVYTQSSGEGKRRKVRILPK
ncbi:MAG: Jag N-terminal domain-containing protein [Ardenticatenaceae bacterium]|nr:Jag N-terminal domain-containing protein [Ardenticatenaceae bacterium]MCB8948366.1 Jag N-terminal domain-containing protein [Ardenticatenaceae bacterium]